MITPLVSFAAVVFLMFAQAKTRRLARLRAAQEAWAEDMDRPSRRFWIDP